LQKPGHWSIYIAEVDRQIEESSGLLKAFDLPNYYRPQRLVLTPGTGIISTNLQNRELLEMYQKAIIESNIPDPDSIDAVRRCAAEPGNETD
jgi:hypothetical protein